MKIVYLNPLGQLGGAERVLLDLIAVLRAEVPDFFPYLIVGSDGQFVEKARALNVPVHILPYPQAFARLGDSAISRDPVKKTLSKVSLFVRLIKGSLSIIPYLWQLRRLITSIAPEIIHTNGFKMHLLGMLARTHKIPIVWHIHDYVSSRPLMGQVVRRFAKYCTQIVTNSFSVAEDVRKVCGERVPIRTIQNAVDLDYFCPSGEKLDLDTIAGLPPAPPHTLRVALLSTMARWKGQEIFLQALAKLPGLPIRGYIIGGALYQTDGSQYSLTELRQLALEIGVSEKVGFTGFINDAASAMRACDIIVHASTQPEPFGLVIAEAMACGRPVIVSKAGGAEELIEEGKNSIGYPPGDAIALSACIEQMVKDEGLRRRLSQVSYTTAKERFNRVRLGQSFLLLYRGLQKISSIANHT